MNGTKFKPKFLVEDTQKLTKKFVSDQTNILIISETYEK